MISEKVYNINDNIDIFYDHHIILMYVDERLQSC